jgi:hypothetical protein
MLPESAAERAMREAAFVTMREKEEQAARKSRRKKYKIAIGLMAGAVFIGLETVEAVAGSSSSWKIALAWLKRALYMAGVAAFVVR